MPGLKIKKGDTVAVIAGKDLGTQGRVLDVIPKKRRVIIEGVNTITRHEKVKTSRRGTPEGGITHKEAAVAISNVALVCTVVRSGPDEIDASGATWVGAAIRARAPYVSSVSIHCSRSDAGTISSKCCSIADRIATSPRAEAICRGRPSVSTAARSSPATAAAAGCRRGRRRPTRS